MPIVSRFLLFLLLAIATFTTAQAQDTEAARAALIPILLAPEKEQPELIEALDPTPVAGEIFDKWQRGRVYIYDAPDGTRIPYVLDTDNAGADGLAPAIRIDNGEPLTADGKTLSFKEDDLEPLETSAKIRRAMKGMLDLLALSDPDPEARKNAILKMGMQQQLKNVSLLEKRLAKETNPSVKKSIHEAIALINLNAPDTETKVAALNRLGEMHSIASQDHVRKTSESEDAAPEVRKAASDALMAIESHLFWVDFYGTIFRGISLGSVLLVVALGLAITFGLMGVINMAHGEMMVVGGYATYLVQCMFGAGAALAPFGFDLPIPGMGLDPSSFGYQSYFIIALPVAFLSAAIVGLLLERSVIQFLYRRPLESLLATWGVSLILKQLFRLIFGPANVPVYSPNWLLGSFTVNDVIMNYNRVFVIGFAILIVLGTSLLLAKTPLGLLIRAVMQNRGMASCMGVRTERVNMLTFAFGSGLAGLAGAFLSQIGNIGPSTGQTYIVDCFMVVVVGGVGNLIGTVISALGIGTLDQILQTLLRNPVLGKVLVLAGIIVFLQWRPQGLFVTRSRGLES